MVVEFFPVTFNLILIGTHICKVYTHYVSSKIQHFHNELITSGPPALFTSICDSPHRFCASKVMASRNSTSDTF